MGLDGEIWGEIWGIFCDICAIFYDILTTFNAIWATFSDIWDIFDDIGAIFGDFCPYVVINGLYLVTSEPYFVLRNFFSFLSHAVVVRAQVLCYHGVCCLLFLFIELPINKPAQLRKFCHVTIPCLFILCNCSSNPSIDLLSR